jgi:hypothetical protein
MSVLIRKAYQNNNRSLLERIFRLEYGELYIERDFLEKLCENGNHELIEIMFQYSPDIKIYSWNWGLYEEKYSYDGKSYGDQWYSSWSHVRSTLYNPLFIATKAGHTKVAEVLLGLPPYKEIKDLVSLMTKNDFGISFFNIGRPRHIMYARAVSAYHIDQCKASDYQRKPAYNYTNMLIEILAYGDPIVLYNFVYIDEFHKEVTDHHVIYKICQERKSSLDYFLLGIMSFPINRDWDYCRVSDDMDYGLYCLSISGTVMSYVELAVYYGLLGFACCDTRGKFKPNNMCIANINIAAMAAMEFTSAAATDIATDIDDIAVTNPYQDLICIMYACYYSDYIDDIHSDYDLALMYLGEIICEKPDNYPFMCFARTASGNYTAPRGRYLLGAYYDMLGDIYLRKPGNNHLATYYFELAAGLDNNYSIDRMKRRTTPTSSAELTSHINALELGSSFSG